MQKVIDIPEDIYIAITRMGLLRIPDDMQKVVDKAIQRGTPLPKGHGRLIDADELRCENADFDTYNDYCTMFDEIDAAETIIEADKAESEDKKK